MNESGRDGMVRSVAGLLGEDRKLHGGARASERLLQPTGFRRFRRTLGGFLTAAALTFVGLIVYFLFVVGPRQDAGRQEAPRAAKAFGQLTGMKRRLAIYDAFVAQISAHYYDQSFSGFD